MTIPPHESRGRRAVVGAPYFNFWKAATLETIEPSADKTPLEMFFLIFLMYFFLSFFILFFVFSFLSF